MFPPAMAAQRERLYRTLTATTTPEEELAALGRAHRKFGVRPEHYGAFRASLLATCRHFAAGTAAAASAEAALAAAFDRASAIMTEAAAADSERNPAWWAAEVTEVRSPATDIAVLTLRPGEPLHYLPGQHVSVQTPHWPRLWRRYSIGCAPRADGTITLHVRAVPGGLVSTALVHRTQPGDVCPAESGVSFMGTSDVFRIHR